MKITNTILAIIHGVNIRFEALGETFYHFTDAEPQDEIVVFSERDYDAVMKYKHKKMKKVTLCK